MLFRAPARFFLVILMLLPVAVNFAMASTPRRIGMTVYFHQGQSVLEGHQTEKILGEVRQYQHYDMVALSVVLIGRYSEVEFDTEGEKLRLEQRLDWLVNLLVSNGVPKEIIHPASEPARERGVLGSQVDIEFALFPRRLIGR